MFSPSLFDQSRFGNAFQKILFADLLVSIRVSEISEYLSERKTFCCIVEREVFIFIRTFATFVHAITNHMRNSKIGYRCFGIVVRNLEISIRTLKI